MSTLPIRDLPEDVYQALSLRAGNAHRSLAQQAIVELWRLPELEGRGRRLGTLERIREELAATTACEPSTAPEELLRKDRER